MDESYLQELDVKVERLRAELYKKIDNDENKLSDSSILPLSKELDGLIIDYMRVKNNRKHDPK